MLLVGKLQIQDEHKHKEVLRIQQMSYTFQNEQPPVSNVLNVSSHNGAYRKSSELSIRWSTAPPSGWNHHTEDISATTTRRRSKMYVHTSPIDIKRTRGKQKQIT